MGTTLRPQLGEHPCPRSPAIQRKIPSGLADLPHFLRGNVSFSRWNYTPVPDRVQQRQRHQGQLSDEPQFPLRATLVAVLKARRVDTYAARRDRLAQQLQGATGQVTLRKKNSNLFRDRDRASKPRLDVHDFNHVLQVDPRSGWADAEGMTAYETLVLSTLACGTMPAVVPQLKTITLGGAVAGGGAVSNAFSPGMVPCGGA